MQPKAMFGVVSLMRWALILIISIKYALLILRADNRAKTASWRCAPALRRRRHYAGDLRAVSHRDDRAARTQQ